MDKNSSVLVVDDEPNGFDVIEAHLYREGYDLTYASSGIEALDRLKGLNPDVILLDVMMPQMDGVEVCRQIKSDPQSKHIPIVMVTALNSKEDLARSLNAGADDFLTKPVSGIELRARVRSMLRIKHQYDALQAMLTFREDLSNMIVHDLRNPLTNIMVSSSFLMESNLAEEDLQSLKLIVSAGRQLNLMINDLLVQAKMQAGKMVLNREDVDLNELVAEALSEFKNVITSKNLQLKTQLPETTSKVSVDANLFRRVVDNLLSNAQKFSPRGGTITVGVEYPEPQAGEEEKQEQTSRPVSSTSDRALREGASYAASGSSIQRPASYVGGNFQHRASVNNSSTNIPASKQAIVRISDEGYGISEDLKESIFNKYEVGKVRKGASQIGLGLAFCKMVVEAHGGTIFVGDNQPKGSIFTVVL